MMVLDPHVLIATRLDELIREAQNEHLADVARRVSAHSTRPAPRNTAVRRELASACLRLANWLDGAAHLEPAA